MRVSPLRRPIRPRVQEFETTMWERTALERPPTEGPDRLAADMAAQRTLRTYRRKLPTAIASKLRPEAPPPLLAPPAAQMKVGVGPTNLSGQFVQESLRRAVENRYSQGRNVMLASPDSGDGPPPAVLTRRPPLINLSNFPALGPWYGNYVGPDNPLGRAGEPGAPPPLTPVDRAAYQHDLDYYSVQGRYPSEFSGADPGMVWVQGVISLNPGLQSGLGWADFKLAAINVPRYFIEGIFDGSYGLDDWSADDRHSAFASDLAWAIAISSTHLILATHRFGMAALGLVLEGGQWVTHGIIDFGKRIGGVGGAIIQGIGYGLDFAVQAAVYAGAALWSLASFTLGIGVAIASAIAMPFIYAAAFVGAKIISGIVTVGKAIWEGIKSIGKAIGDFFSSIFALSEAARLAVGADPEIRGTMLRFRDRYIRHHDIDGEFLSKYYNCAPEIAAGIDRRDDAQSVWREAYERWLSPAAECIRRGDNAKGFAHFSAMFEALAEKADVKPGSNRVVRHWKSPLTTT